MKPTLIWKIVFWTWFVLPLMVAAWQIEFTLKMLGVLVVLFFWYVLLGWWYHNLHWAKLKAEGWKQ